MAYPPIATSNAKIADVRRHDRYLEVVWDDQTESRFHNIWLRDNCYCDTCHDPGTHQKMVWLVDIPQDIAPESVEASPEALDITWNAQGHRSRFDAAWLRAFCYSQSSLHARRFVPRTWDAARAHGLSELDYRSVAQSEEVEFEMLELVRNHGFILLRNVPVDPAETERVAERFGFIRETNWGRILDIKTETDAVNIANTGAPIAPHTDDAYRYAMPGIDMFHCLKAEQVRGGDSLLVDGYRVAEVLREENRRAFELLSTIGSPQFAMDVDTELRARGRIFTVDDDGAVVGVRYCECTQAPLDLPGELVEPFYAALRALALLVQRDELVFKFRLGPGDMVVFDNQRVLHGRTSFEGARHLRSAYVDRDGFHSRLRVLGQRYQRTDFHLRLPVGAGH